MRTLSWLFAMTLALTACTGSAGADAGFESIDFPTSGGFTARADVYDSAKPSATWILLFHQAGWSRGEYREIAPKLVDKGYRVMAVDQRSGRAVNGVKNETHGRAVKEKLGTDYVDAYGDLQSALAYAREKLGAKRVVVWGSSYSASLVLRLAAEHSKDVLAVVSFSPGEYFERRGASYVKEFAKRVTQPLFVTSSKKERPEAHSIFSVSPSKKKIIFTPASTGQHGSRALWSKWPDSDVYWAAVNGFLAEYAPPAAPSK